MPRSPAQVLSCTYTLSDTPKDLTQLYVYESKQPIARDTTHAGGWDYNTATNQITFYGAACQALQSGKVSDLVIVYGCPLGHRLTRTWQTWRGVCRAESVLHSRKDSDEAPDGRVRTRRVHIGRACPGPGRGGGGKHHGPPPAAFDACKGKAEGDVCTFKGRKRTVEGTCQPARKVEALVCRRAHADK